MQGDTGGFKVKDKFLMFKAILHCVDTSRNLQKGATLVGDEYVKNRWKLEEVVRDLRAVHGSQTGKLNGTEAELRELLILIQTQSKSEYGYAGFSEELDRDPENLTENDKRSLRKTFPYYAEYEQNKNSWLRLRSQYEQICSDRNIDMSRYPFRGTLDAGRLQEILPRSPELRPFYEALGKIYEYCQTFLQTHSSTAPVALVVCQQMDKLFGSEDSDWIRFLSRYDPIDSHRHALPVSLTSREPYDTSYTSRSQAASSWVASLATKLVYQQKAHSWPDLCLKLLKVAKKARDAPRGMLSASGSKLKDALKGYYGAAMSLYKVQPEWLSMDELAVHKALHEFLDLFERVSGPQEPKKSVHAWDAVQIVQLPAAPAESHASASHASAPADVKSRRAPLLDRTFQMLSEDCLIPCKHQVCPSRNTYKHVTDNARLPCRMCVYRNDENVTEGLSEIPDAIYRGDAQKFGHSQKMAWWLRTPRQLFLYNEKILKEDFSHECLKIKCICRACGRTVEECHALDTKEKLHLEIREYIAHDRKQPMLYDPETTNLDIPDDARTVCSLSHFHDVNAFAKNLESRIEAIRASLRSGVLQKKLDEKGRGALAKFGTQFKTYIRIGLGLKALKPLTAVLELWPRDYSSPKHHHGGCAGSIRVLYGELFCKLYRTLLDEEPMSFQKDDCGGLEFKQGSDTVLSLKAGRTTWLNRQNWWVHEVACSDAYEFALSLHLYKSCTDEFAFVEKKGNTIVVNKPEEGKGVKNDFFWNYDDLPKKDLRKEDQEVEDFDKLVLKAALALP